MTGQKRRPGRGTGAAQAVGRTKSTITAPDPAGAADRQRIAAQRQRRAQHRKPGKAGRRRVVEMAGHESLAPTVEELAAQLAARFHSEEHSARRPGRRPRHGPGAAWASAVDALDRPDDIPPDGGP